MPPSLALFDPTRHEPLSPAPWDPRRLREAVRTIARDTEAAYDPSRLWPLHPEDDDGNPPPGGVFRGLYLGAAGTVHALCRLASARFYEPRLNLHEVVEGLIGHTRPLTDEAGAESSLMLGASGILLLAHRLAPSAARADALAGLIAANIHHPANEVLYGAPGTMLAARAMYRRTGEERFAQLWKKSAQALLARQNPANGWTQELGGRPACYIGAAHGFVGNIAALLDAPEWLDDAQLLEARAIESLQRWTLAKDGLVNWPVAVDAVGSGVASRVQWCHGAGGIIIAMAGKARENASFTRLLAAAGELVWRAGPLAGNAGLCHGTAGNGFAFLALFARSGEERWLDRARAFAMHAILQAEQLQAANGRGWHGLYTGDLGAALLAAACLQQDPRFPGIDDLE